MIRYQCHSCGCKLKAPDHRAGQNATCPKCNSKVPVPHADTVSLSDTDFIPVKSAEDSHRDMIRPQSPPTVPPRPICNVPESWVELARIERRKNQLFHDLAIAKAQGSMQQDHYQDLYQKIESGEALSLN